MKLLSIAHVTQQLAGDAINQWDIFFMQVEDAVRVYIGDYERTITASTLTDDDWNGFEYPTLEAAQTELALDMLSGDMVDCEVEYEEAE